MTRGRLPAAAMLLACALLACLATTVSADGPKYSVGFEQEHQVIADFARSAEARAFAVGADFNHVAVEAKKAAEVEVLQQRAHEQKIAQLQAQKAAAEAARQQRLAAYRERQKQHLVDLQARLAKTKADLATVQAQRAANKSVKGVGKNKRRAEKRAAAKAAAAAGAAKTPVASASVAPKSLLQHGASLLSLESPVLRIPDWPSLTPRGDTSVHVSNRMRGAPGQLVQPDASHAKNILQYPKHSGRESYSEHFQEWPQEAKPKQSEAKAQAKAIAEFRKAKFLHQPAQLPAKLRARVAGVQPIKKVVPARKGPQTAIEKAKAGVLPPNPKPAIQSKPQPAPATKAVSKPAAAAPAALPVAPPAVQQVKKEAKTATVDPPKQPTPPAEKFNPWPIVGIVVGVLGTAALCGGLWMLLRRKPQAGGGQEAQMDGYHEV